MTGHEHFDELAAGQALHALEPADEQEFLAHLESCETCQRSLADFSEAAAGLAMSSATTDESPPPQLWTAIKAQLGDAATPVASRRRASPWLAVAAAAALVAAGVVGWQLARSSSSGGAINSALSSCRHDARCTVLQLKGQQTSQSAYLMITGQDVRVATASLPAINSASERYVLWQMPQDALPIGVVAFTLPAKHGATVAHGRLTRGYDATTLFAISLEHSTTIPARPSAPVVSGAQTSA